METNLLGFRMLSITKVYFKQKIIIHNNKNQKFNIRNNISIFPYKEPSGLTFKYVLEKHFAKYKNKEIKKLKIHFKIDGYLYKLPTLDKTLTAIEKRNSI